MWLAAYDISSQKQRARAAKLLESYGSRIQGSVFLLAQPSRSDRQKIWKRIQELLDPETDRFLLWQVRGDAPERHIGALPLMEEAY